MQITGTRTCYYQPIKDFKSYDNLAQEARKMKYVALVNDLKSSIVIQRAQNNFGLFRPVRVMAVVRWMALFAAQTESTAALMTQNVIWNIRLVSDRQ